MVFFCRKNYTIQKSVSLRLIFSQNGDRNKDLILLKPAKKNCNNKINNKNNNDANMNNLSERIVHVLKQPYKSNHSNDLIKSLKAPTKSLPEKDDVRITLQEPN